MSFYRQYDDADRYAIICEAEPNVISQGLATYPFNSFLISSLLSVSDIKKNLYTDTFLTINFSGNILTFYPQIARLRWHQTWIQKQKKYCLINVANWMKKNFFHVTWEENPNPYVLVSSRGSQGRRKVYIFAIRQWR